MSERIVLFKTEDGKDVFEFDTIYFINKNTYEIGKTNKVDYIAEKKKDYDRDYLYFSNYYEMAKYLAEQLKAKNELDNTH